MSKTQHQFYPQHNRHNPLLLKDDVGKAKPSAYDLPPIEFTYGCPLERDEEGAKEVSMTWKFHRETRDRIPDRDFVKLNKMSLTQGFHKANDLSQYRKQVDARKKVVKGHNALPLYIPEEDFRYGIPNRPSTPMKLVMGNCYGLEYQQRLEQEYVQRLQQSQMKTKLLPKGNKASDLNYTYNKEKLKLINDKNKKELFKISKFKSVNPRTDTNLHRNKSKNRNEQVTNENQNQNQNNAVPNQAVE